MDMVTKISNQKVFNSMKAGFHSEDEIEDLHDLSSAKIRPVDSNGTSF